MISPIGEIREVFLTMNKGCKACAVSGHYGIKKKDIPNHKTTCAKKKDENKAHVNHKQKPDWSSGFMKNCNNADGILKRELMHCRDARGKNCW